MPGGEAVRLTAGGFAKAGLKKASVKAKADITCSAADFA
jgi:hypothetical protein